VFESIRLFLQRVALWGYWRFLFPNDSNIQSPSKRSSPIMRSLDETVYRDGIDVSEVVCENKLTL
jgi:hypothetical protein